MAWFLFVSDVNKTEGPIARDYNRLGALVVEQNEKGNLTPSGCSWKELDLNDFNEDRANLSWDEETITLVPNFNRYVISWGEMWDRFKTEEQNALFDLAMEDPIVNRYMERLKIQISRPDTQFINMAGRDSISVLTYLVQKGVLSPGRAQKMKEG